MIFLVVGIRAVESSEVMRFRVPSTVMYTSDVPPVEPEVDLPIPLVADESSVAASSSSPPRKRAHEGPVSRRSFGRDAGSV